MSISFIQSTGESNNITGSYISNYLSSVNKGDLIVGVVGGISTDNLSIISITDTLNTTYILQDDGSLIPQITSGSAVFYGFAQTSGNNNITVNFGTSVLLSNLVMMTQEFSGVSTNNITYYSDSGIAITSHISSGHVFGTPTTDLIWVAGWDQHSPTWSAGIGFTNLTHLSGLPSCAIEYVIGVSTTGIISAEFGNGSGGTIKDDWAGFVFSFEPA